MSVPYIGDHAWLITSRQTEPDLVLYRVGRWGCDPGGGASCKEFCCVDTCPPCTHATDSKRTTTPQTQNKRRPPPKKNTRRLAKPTDTTHHPWAPSIKRIHTHTQHNTTNNRARTHIHLVDVGVEEGVGEADGRGAERVLTRQGHVHAPLPALVRGWIVGLCGGVVWGLCGGDVCVYMYVVCVHINTYIIFWWWWDIYI